MAGYLRQQAANIGASRFAADARNIRCPTLVLVGDSDQLTPPERAVRRSPAASARRALVTVPACGHLSTLERPAAVNEALLALAAG